MAVGVKFERISCRKQTYLFASIKLRNQAHTMENSPVQANSPASPAGRQIAVDGNTITYNAKDGRKFIFTLRSMKSSEKLDLVIQYPGDEKGTPHMPTWDIVGWPMLKRDINMFTDAKGKSVVVPRAKIAISNWGPSKDTLAKANASFDRERKFCIELTSILTKIAEVMKWGEMRQALSEDGERTVFTPYNVTSPWRKYMSKGTPDADASKSGPGSGAPSPSHLVELFNVAVDTQYTPQIGTAPIDYLKQVVKSSIVLVNGEKKDKLTGGTRAELWAHIAEKKGVAMAHGMYEIRIYKSLGKICIKTIESMLRMNVLSSKLSYDTTEIDNAMEAAFFDMRYDDEASPATSTPTPSGLEFKAVDIPVDPDA